MTQSIPYIRAAIVSVGTERAAQGVLRFSQISLVFSKNTPSPRSPSNSEDSVHRSPLASRVRAHHGYSVDSLVQHFIRTDTS